MELKNVIVDTRDMSYKEIDALIQNLRQIRTRKHELHSRVSTMQAMVANMKDDQMAWVNKYTGEIFQADDWELYDETTNTFYYEER